jgi:AcrR family transcriptional regulator
MATRPYEQHLRAEQAQETRRRVLDAVAGCLRDAPTEPPSIDRIAHAARVSRSTIYLVFGSRAGLFDAFAEDLWARTGLPALTAAVAHRDVRQHLRGAVDAACRMFANDHQIYRVLHAMARLDPDSVGGAATKMNVERRGGMAHLAARLADQGVLRDDVTVDTAEDILWALCSFEMFDLLHGDRQLTLDDTIQHTITTIERTLCRPTRRTRTPAGPTEPDRTRRVG